MNVHDAINGAASFAFSELEYIESEVVRVPYPENTYDKLLKIDTSAGAGATSVAHKVLDFNGEPALIGSKSGDIPLLELGANKGSVSVHIYGLGYSYSQTELLRAAELKTQSKSAAIDMLSEAPRAVFESIERKSNSLFLIGDPKTADLKRGLLNNKDVPTATTGSLLGDSSQTIDQILDQAVAEDAANDLLKLVQNAITQVEVTQSKNTTKVTHVLLPKAQFNRVKTFRIPNTNVSLLSYLEQNLTGVDFMGIPELAGIAPSSKDRMMIYAKHDLFVKGHMPKPFSLYAPATADGYNHVITGTTNVAGTEIRAPKMHLYVEDV